MVIVITTISETPVSFIHGDTNVVLSYVILYLHTHTHTYIYI